MKRYILTVDLYVYADSDEGAKIEAQKICDKINERNDRIASVVSIHESKFGKIGEARKVK